MVGTVTKAVDLRQIAPTILNALGMHANELQAVRMERTKRLPKVHHDDDDDEEDDDRDE